MLKLASVIVEKKFGKYTLLAAEKYVFFIVIEYLIPYILFEALS